jgi:predicted aspartyl protease
MSARIVSALACVAALAAFAGPASAACTRRIEDIPVTMRGLRPVIEATINGHKSDFLLDSGSGLNAINTKLAADLNLKAGTTIQGNTRIGTADQLEITGAAGKGKINAIVAVPRFEFQNGSFKDVQFMATDRIGAVDGIIGQPVLHAGDVDYDLAGGKVHLVRTTGCHGLDLLSWIKDGQAYSEIPMELIERNATATEAFVYVNGVKLRAMFDTGASSTFITERAAERVGVKTSDPNVKAIAAARGLDADVKSWVGAFTSVKIGDEEVQNAPMIISESNASADFDVLLGADFFLSHHVYVANGENKIYFTYSGGPVFRVPLPQALPSQASGPPGTGACTLQAPLAPSPLGEGTVTVLMNPAQVRANIDGGQAQLHATMDPDYVGRVAVLVHLDNGRDQVGRLPPGQTAQVGDRVALQSMYRNVALPCHYIPNVITASLGPSKSTAQK